MKTQNYPKAQYQKDQDHLFMFEIYLKGGEKYNTDYYTRDNAKIMSAILKSKGETFQIWEANMNDNYLNEVTL